MMPASHRYQNGSSFFSLLLVLSLLGFAVFLVLKIGPAYLDNSKMTSVIKTIQKTADINLKSKPEIRSMLGKQFDLNYITHIKAEDFDIVTEPGHVKVGIEYERVVHLFGNLSALIEFHEGFETNASD
jgi:hypothetical protein